MLDPFPVHPPAPLVALVHPIAEALSLPILALHFHEVIFALGLYTFIACVVSPRLSTWLFPDKYPRLSKRTRINWDVHVVSFVQSCIICTLSLYLIFFDEERRLWRAEGMWDRRIWGYTGMTGLVQSFALGYFLWDFYMCSRYVHIFGWGMLAHAMFACTVFALGFRPFVYFYCPIFLLYELSSPFLNIHWFCDKLELTGSSIQAINGAFLTATFFCCRLVWGAWSSFWAFKDMFHAIQAGYTNPSINEQPYGWAKENDTQDPEAQTTAFMGVHYIPLWLASAYLASNLVLNLLNYYWFSKMVQTIRSRFDPPWGTKGTSKGPVHWQPQEKPLPEKPLPKTPVVGKGNVKAARQRTENAMNGAAFPLDTAALVQKGVHADGHKSVEVTGRRRVRSRRRA